MNGSDVIKLFPNCIPVKGARRSVLCDLATGRMKLIPNGLHEVLSKYPNDSIDDIKAAYHHRHDREIESYFNFILAENWGFCCETPEDFPEMDLSFESPERIHNAIIDTDADSNHDYRDLFQQLIALGCRYIQLRFFSPRPHGECEAILSLSEDTPLLGLDLVIPFAPDTREDRLFDWCKRYRRIFRIVIHGAPENRRVQPDPAACLAPLEFVETPITSHHHCGFTHRNSFQVSMAMFTESMTFNNCLHKKIAIDARGDIRNCPAMPEQFGSTGSASLAQALDHGGFRDFWTVTKDQVEVCRDCEFRYVCLDCRAHPSRPGDRLSKPEGCGYDPYTATWQNPPLTISLTV